MSVNNTLSDLESRVQESFNRQCKMEAFQTKNYLAEKQGCDLNDVILPEDFADNLYIVENGAKHLFGPYWAKRIGDNFVVLRNGRRFCVDDLSEIIWGDDEDDDLWEDDVNDFSNCPGYGPTHPNFRKCRMIPYTKELEQMMLWGETSARLIDVNTLLNEHIKKQARRRKVLIYGGYGVVGAFLMLMAWKFFKFSQ